MSMKGKVYLTDLIEEAIGNYMSDKIVSTHKTDITYLLDGDYITTKKKKNSGYEEVCLISTGYMIQIRKESPILYNIYYMPYENKPTKLLGKIFIVNDKYIRFIFYGKPQNGIGFTYPLLGKLMVSLIKNIKDYKFEVKYIDTEAPSKSSSMYVSSGSLVTSPSKVECVVCGYLNWNQFLTGGHYEKLAWTYNVSQLDVYIIR